jgi:hypothetical protein
MRWVPRALSSEVNLGGVKLTTHPHLVLKRGTRVVTEQYLHTPLWLCVWLSMGTTVGLWFTEIKPCWVRLTTLYGLDGQGIETQWQRVCLYLSRPTIEPTQHPIQYSRYWVIPASEAARCGVNPPPFSAEFKERVELYLCFPSAPSWQVISLNFRHI